MLLRYVVVLFAALVIAYLFPKDNFNYDFAFGEVWNYEDINAPFLFTINKHPDSLAAEQARVEKAFKPYYRLEQETPKQVKDKILYKLGRRIEELNTDSNAVFKVKDSVFLAETAVDLWEQVYKRGVVELADEHKDATGASIHTHVFVKDGNRVSERKVGEPGMLKARDICAYANQYFKTVVDSSENFLVSIVCESIDPNVLFDKALSDKILSDKLNAIATTKGVVRENETIIANGALVNNENNTFEKLMSLKELYQKQGSDDAQNQWGGLTVFIGHFFLALLVISVFVFFLSTLRKETFSNLRELVFLLLLIVLFLALVRWGVRVQQVSGIEMGLYVIPFCVIPIIIRSFFGSYIAHYAHLVVILLTGFIVPLGFDFLFLHLVAGLVAIITNERTYYWSDYFRSISMIFLAYVVGYVAIQLLRTGNLQDLELSAIGWLFINVLLTLAAYQLIPLLEKLFGFISSITLIELSDPHRGILKELSRKAPGTYNHSTQVAIMSEAAAAAIGANALLTKVGALYHDIGKIAQPAYFIENQKSGINPHDDLPPMESARIIIGHITNGIELAKKEKLPNAIIDFIRTHHGTTRTEYFWRTYLRQYPDNKEYEKNFSYPGPLPYSRETAILMMADSIEAASRTLNDPTDENINNLVEGIIQGKIGAEQFQNCPISFQDINTVKKVFKKHLRSIYHTRVSYNITSQN